jgi:tetratricopeptide (TPR) repeat protein
MAEYRKVLELKPGLYEAELNLGILLLRNQSAAEAVGPLQAAAEAKPKEFRPRVYLAEALLASGQAAKAEESFKVALELDPKSAAAEVGLGRAQARQDRLQEAAPHFRRAAEIDPGFRDVLLELAELYEKHKQPAEAQAIYRQFPENVAAQERLGELLLESKNYAEAIPRLEEVFKQDPTAANRLALGTAYLFNKQLDKALPVLAASAAAEPGNYDIRMIYGRALRDAKQYPAAAQQFYEAVKLKQDSRQAWNELAGMLYLMERYPQSLAAFDQALKLGEDTPVNHYFRAIILDRMKQYEPAAASYQRFLAMSQGKNPDEEFKARQRLRVIEKELSKR